MSIETFWYILVGLYLFWLTAAAVFVSVFGVLAFRSLAALRQSLRATKPAPKFDPSTLPRKHRRKS